ncbi:hypothetical protein K5X82_05020 [Halosquirtibacter xylanolyticus]|uniref:hypothetical protein n=1 Tax=Halosquirtibacter xylanolyticus TaxID=3374599 RepID=UPI0037484519|nr:hypothetical protein K5X82_05020 [Prolixibacteraceae bacterium]
MKTILIETMNQEDKKQFEKRIKISLGILNLRLQNINKNIENENSYIQDYLLSKIDEDVYLESYIQSEFENIIAQEKARNYHNIIIDSYSFYETSLKNLCELKSLPTNRCPNGCSIPQHLLNQLNIQTNNIPETNKVDVFRLLRNNIIHNDSKCKNVNDKNRVIIGVGNYTQDHSIHIYFSNLKFRIIKKDLIQFYIDDIYTITSYIINTF